MSVNPLQDFAMQSVMDIGLQYINGLRIIKASRNEGKKIIGGFMPPMELCFSTDQTKPIWLPRFTEFPFQGLFNAFNKLNKFRVLALSVKIWNLFQGILSKISSSKMSPNLNKFSSAFSGLNQISETANYDRDSCIQMRLCYGAYLKYQHEFDLLMGGFDANNCLYFAKCYERIGRQKPLFFFQKPYGDKNVPHALELVIRELEDFFQLLEKLTNESIDYEKVKEKMRLVNDVKKMAALILNRYFKKGYVPLHWPASVLLHGAFVDYLSDIKFFHEKLRLLIAEIEANIKSGTIRNYKKEDIPRILFVGSPGFDPVLAQAIDNQGGSLLYIDIFPNKLRYELIDLSGDFILKYAYYLLGRTNFTKGIENSIDFWIRQASLLHVDGIVFNDVWGCRFVAPSFRLFKDRVQEELEIPVVGVGFHEMGENVGQISTRIEAFMELVK
ncbi:MAG: 2-hydroxyacyl-CoA dehydratase [Candidatus Helarchaeota archaeon]|nr:2-hydroxyacyl-CoA dehydratase [Candidatus Helarchaeota archaeon]